jgi:hypothetical protein
MSLTHSLESGLVTAAESFCDEQSKKKDAANALATATGHEYSSSPRSPSTPSHSPPKQSRKAAKKGKGKSKGKEKDTGEYDLDKALAELSVKYVHSTF